ncbi:unnamed protein product [Rangifer tarandus platyrhynchus]|uniref:Uncharacterized protein n=2 Tax=Rangifer tarandus platyrhynchus TaxID=3082113 RepID=A0ABN8Z2I6_RANTA|nr:unnamed protein product [Rangifer tarandus platyrhynchus]CAI9705210.1 unnamed protein product [Rangifer tarandus platyrhynchus]
MASWGLGNNGKLPLIPGASGRIRGPKGLPETLGQGDLKLPSPRAAIATPRARGGYLLMQIGNLEGERGPGEAE